jgi:hypothetical protein
MDFGQALLVIIGFVALIGSAVILAELGKAAQRGDIE